MHNEIIYGAQKQQLLTSLNGKQPRADERSECLTRLREQRYGTKHERRDGLVATVYHGILIDKV